MPKVPAASSLEEEVGLHMGLMCQRAGQGHPHVAFTEYLDKAVADPFLSISVP